MYVFVFLRRTVSLFGYRLETLFLDLDLLFRVALQGVEIEMLKDRIEFSAASLRSLIHHFIIESERG